MPALALALQLLTESFDDPRALERWEEVDGARLGTLPVSTAALDDGALRLEADRSTRRWLALTRTAPLGETAWIRVSARMRTEDVSPDGARFANCNVFIRMGDAPLETTRILTGTQEWTALARRLPVPDGAREITVGCFLSMPGRAWFDDVRVEAVDPPAWEAVATDHFDYRWMPGDAIPPAQRERNERDYGRVAEFLGVDDGPRVSYFRYHDEDAMEEFVGERGAGFRRGRTVHTIRTDHIHEVVHVLADAWGDPPAILGEGIAVYLSGGWQGRPVRDAARAVLDAGRWVALGDLVDTRRLRGHSDEVTYPIIGAFVEWVVETRGRDALRGLYGAMRNEAAEAENRRALEEALGGTIEEADAALREWAGGR